MYVYGTCLFFMAVLGSVGMFCCVAAVVKDSVFISLGMLKYIVCLCKGCDGMLCFSVCIVDAWRCRCSCMGSMSVFVMQMYVCVLCASCGSYQCCILHDLQFVNAGQGMQEGDHMEEDILQSRSHDLQFYPILLL